MIVNVIYNSIEIQSKVGNILVRVNRFIIIALYYIQLYISTFLLLNYFWFWFLVLFISINLTQKRIEMIFDVFLLEISQNTFISRQ